jgi:hypothetical protein
MFFTLQEASMPAFKYFNDINKAIEFATRNPYKWDGSFILRNKKENATKAGTGFLVVPHNKLRSATIMWDVVIEMEIKFPTSK